MTPDAAAAFYEDDQDPAEVFARFDAGPHVVTGPSWYGNGGTLPLAATVATSKIFDAFLSDDSEAALMHGPTYMAYPLGCAAANASLDLFASEPRLRQTAAIEAQLREELAPCRRAPGVADVRIKGAVGVVQMERPVNAAVLRARFVEKGVWIKPFGDILYLTPPLVIEPPELSALTGAIHDVLHSR